MAIIRPVTAQPAVSVVIPNFNGAFYLEECLRSLLRQSVPGAEIIVVDDGSRDGSIDIARRVAPQAVVLAHSRNLGFAAAANTGIRTARGDWIAILNNDTEVAETWMAECLQAIECHPDASFLACRILDYKQRDRLYSAGDCFLRAGVGYRRGQERPDQGEYQRLTNIFSPCGCAAIYRRSALEQTGGYDERFFAYLEDVELGLRLQASGRIGYYVPSAVVYHHGATTSGGEFSSLSIRLRTRNSLLLLFKSVPGPALWRMIPMIVVSQLFWFGRVLAHGGFLAYVRGLAAVVPLIPVMLADRRRMREVWRSSGSLLWQAILRSEDVARADFPRHASEPTSWFLRFYFRLFPGHGHRA